MSESAPAEVTFVGAAGTFTGPKAVGRTQELIWTVRQADAGPMTRH